MSELHLSVTGVVVAAALLTPIALTGRARAQALPGSGAVPCLVQADFHRAATGTEVSLAVGVEGPDPWTLLAAVATAGAGPDEAPITRMQITGGRGVNRRIHDLVLPPGDYQLRLELRRGAVASRGTTPLKVPDLSGSRLVASPVVLGESVAASATEGAFQFGPVRVTPAIVNRFAQGDRLHLAFRVFGWRPDAESKPDLTVEYVFYQRVGGRHRFFNKTRPQEVNAKTLSPAFDGRSGAVATGLALPLGPFPPGDFQVIIRVHDKKARTTTEQQTAFIVGPA